MPIGTDTGGTFTDLVTADGAVVKVSSDRQDPAEAVRRALLAAAMADDGSLDLLAHGTTVATNALLERRGAAVALVTNAGCEDVVEIARQDRPSLYDAFADRPRPLVDRRWRHGVAGRLDAEGGELEPCRPELLDPLAPAVQAVAVCLLHSDLDDRHERQVAAELQRRGHDVTISSAVSPEFREYERTVTTVINAYLRPVCRGYLRRLEPLARQIRVMTSAGGLLGAAEEAELPVRLLLSGPAGGVRAAAAAAVAAGYPDAVTFDMGGTSTDVCLILNGAAEPAAWREVDGLPVRVPSLDVHTIGAGGGSIAAVDTGGALQVGPRSAGAQPGPACYGRGGTDATVTDANLVLGRIPATATFGDLGRLDVQAARAALQRGGVDAADVVAVVNANMEQAIRQVTVERGVDPAGLALVAFGGAGPLHAADLADALGMAAVVIPARAGVLSAVGMLCAPQQRDLVRSWPEPGEHDAVAGGLDELARRAVELIGGEAPEPGEVTVELAVDARYRGQSHELTVPVGLDGEVVTPAVMRRRFDERHRAFNGFERPDATMEVVALRARAVGRPAVRFEDLPVPARPTVVGPAVLDDPDCTVWIPDGWVGEPAGGGALVLRRTGGGR
ncbi:MAG: hydantoinase/oxoprolinase family protein [Acidimicrobiales bacterium]|nr:hydantoinase/oxoprolinase family protein [Acidimicrobiales bacterium]